MFVNFYAISHSLELFLWMLGSFLIGYIFAMLFYSKNASISVDHTQYEMTKNSTDKRIDDEPQELVIRARKTVDRGGIEIKTPKQLDLQRIGIATAEEKDDLLKIKGVGPSIERKLNEIGIFTFKQIANLNETDIETVTNLIQFFPGRIKRDNWKAQASELLNTTE